MVSFSLKFLLGTFRIYLIFYMYVVLFTTQGLCIVDVVNVLGINLILKVHNYLPSLKGMCNPI